MITGGVGDERRTDRSGQRLCRFLTAQPIPLRTGQGHGSATGAHGGQGRLPVPFCRLDVVVMVTSGLTLASWIILPEHRATAVLSLCSGLLNCIRLGRWAGEQTWPEPLVFILHVAYAFVPIGFVLLALSILTTGIVAQSGALHGWTTGAVGLMTLAVMTRASLGLSAARRSPAT